MTNITITVSGLDEIERRFGRATVPALMRKPMEKSMIRLQARMSNYPPTRSGQKYVRGYGYPGGPRTSENLGKRWTYRVTQEGGGLQGKLGNNASYVALVQNKRLQAIVHRGRWQTDEDVLRAETPAIVRDFELGVRDAVREAGLSK